LSFGIRVVLCLCLGLAALTRATSFAQSAPDQPKPVDFGSSLERLKWDPEKRRAVLTPAEKGGESGSADEEVVRIETTLVVSDALVLDDRGFPVRGLNKDDFLIREGNEPQEIGTFALGNNASLARSIVLVIDYSNSQAPFIDNSIEAAKTLVDQLNQLDRMAIVTDDVELLTDFTSNKVILKEKLDSLKKKVSSRSLGSSRFGRSRQYSALMSTLLEKFGHDDERPIIIFQTDGDELQWLRDAPEPRPPARIAPEAWIRLQKNRRANLREFSLADVYRAVENSRVTIYTVIPGVRLVGLAQGEEPQKLAGLNERLKVSAGSMRSPKPTEATVKSTVELMRPQQLALIGVSKLSGGWTEFLEEPAQAAGIYSRIISDMNRRYIIGYYPTNKEHDGKRREVKIEVRNRPQYTVWGRKSYYAPEPK
jgi:VWFA-related protein